MFKKFLNSLLVAILLLGASSSYAGFPGGIFGRINEDDNRRNFAPAGFCGAMAMGPGVSYFDVARAHEQKAFTEGEMAKSGPGWTKLGSGVGLWAVCKNSECKAYNKEVVVNLGIGLFYIIKNGEFVIRSVCPACKRGVIPGEPVFTACWYKMAGIKHGDSGNSTWSSSWKKIEEDQWIRCNSEDRKAIFDAFKIETKSLSDPTAQEETF